jgi:hypothetical protein
LKMARFGALYTIAVSCVLVWRGTWVGWDVVYEKYHPHNKATAGTGTATTTGTTTSTTTTTNTPVHLHPAVGPAQHAIERRTTVSATDPGHATTSGVLSHLVAISLLVGTGLFASVLAPPAATGVIRDFMVKSTITRTSQQYCYSGPAQKLVQLLWHQSPSSSNRAQAMVVQRNYMSQATTSTTLVGKQPKFLHSIAHAANKTSMTRPTKR